MIILENNLTKTFQIQINNIDSISKQYFYISE